jgi:glutaredoxin
LCEASSTFSPLTELLYRYSKRAKELLASLELQSPAKVIEVDLRGKKIHLHISALPSGPAILLEDRREIKQLLTHLTHHATFPNILVKGRSLGGSDNLANLHSNNRLMPLLLNAGIKTRDSRGS